MSDATRKAVVTTAQVQAALDNYMVTRGQLAGLKAPETQEFDKGARGKGFATYDADGNVVTSWETKEAALGFYVAWVQVAGEVVTLQAIAKNVKPAAKTAEKPAA